MNKPSAPAKLFEFNLRDDSDVPYRPELVLHVKAQTLFAAYDFMEPIGEKLGLHICDYKEVG